MQTPMKEVTSGGQRHVSTLDDFVAGALKRAADLKSAKRKSGKTKADDAYTRTKAELRAMQLEACVPMSIHLRMTTQTCNCGEVYDSINSVPLAKCVSTRLTHFRPEPDLEPYKELPWFTEVYNVDIPYCHACYEAQDIVIVEEPHAKAEEK